MAIASPISSLPSGSVRDLLLSARPFLIALLRVLLGLLAQHSGEFAEEGEEPSRKPIPIALKQADRRIASEPTYIPLGTATVGNFLTDAAPA